MGKFEEGNEFGKATQFKRGESGNPGGMKKGFKSFRSLIRELAEKNITCEDLDKKDVTMTAGEALITSLYGKAIYKNDVTAGKALIEHLEGKSVQISGDADNPICVKMINEEDAKLIAEMNKRDE